MDIGREYHSAVGMGSILTTLLAFFFIWIDKPILIILSPLILAITKEIIDFFTHGKPSFMDIVDSLNPTIIIKAYFKRVNFNLKDKRE